MKIALVASGKTSQDQDLVESAKKKNIELDVISVTHIKLHPQRNPFDGYNVVYWRVGNLEMRQLCAYVAYQFSIPFINSAYYKNPLMGSKAHQIAMLSNYGIRTPKTVFATFHQDKYQNIAEQVGIPFIAKATIGAQGKEVQLIKSVEEFAQLDASNSTLFQEYIENDGDYRVFVIGNKAVAAYKRVPKDGEFRANISQGGHGEPITDEILKSKLFELGSKSAEAMSLEICGVDIIKNQENLYVIETNSIPQWQGIKETTGVPISNLIIDYLASLVR